MNRTADHLERSSSPSFLATVTRFPSDKVSAWLLAIAQSTMDGVIIIDAMQRLVLLNGEAERLFGYGAKQLLGKPLDILLPVFLQEEHRLRMANFTNRLKGRRVIRTRVDLEGVRANGEIFPFYASLSRVKVRGEVFLVMIVRDATEQVAIEQKYKRASTAMRKWAVSSQNANEVEKRRFSRKLYDDLGQRLSVLKLDMDWLESSLSHLDRGTPERIAQMQALLDSVILSTKTMASTLRPPLLDDFGLMPAIDWLAENFRKKNGIPCVIENHGKGFKSADAVESAFFRVVQEALLNIERHANAKHVKITILYADTRLDVIIEDDGIGLAPGAESKPGCYGMIAMQERVYILGGTISIKSRKSEGVAIHVSIPVEPKPVAPQQDSIS